MPKKQSFHAQSASGRAGSPSLLGTPVLAFKFLPLVNLVQKAKSTSATQVHVSLASGLTSRSTRTQPHVHFIFSRARAFPSLPIIRLAAGPVNFVR